MTVRDIPTLNACLNALATLLIVTGFVFIKRAQRAADPARRAANIRRHRAAMVSAAVVSALFLIGYLTYHGMRRGGHTSFSGPASMRPVYLTILWTHIPLAAAIAFLVPRTFWLALKGDYVRHRAWAKWTFPIWLYVSVTGVLVYLFLYRLWPAAA